MANNSILPSIIILKNSIIEGRIPLDTDLEVGELALQLHKGEEAIYAKNDEGEVINLIEKSGSDINVDQLWGSIFFKYETEDEFNKDLEEGAIDPTTSIVFIKGDNNKGKIWNDGVFYTSQYDEEEIDKILSSKIIKIPVEVYNLDNSSSSEDISIAFKGTEGFTEIIEKAINSDTISFINLTDGGSSPVSLIPKVISETESELRLEWISFGNYVIETVKLNETTFSIQKNIIDFSTYNDLKNKVDNIYNFNKELVSPVINGTWTVYNQSEEEVKKETIKNLQLEEGYKVKFSGTFTWKSEEGKKNPEEIAEGNWSALSGDGIASSSYNSDFLTNNTTIYIKLAAPKTGLIVDGNNVVVASGNDYSQDQVTLTFLPGKSYWGIIKKNTEINSSDITSLSNSELKKNKNMTINSVSLNNDSYFIYAYPQEYGDLSYITQDGVAPVLGAFTKSTVEVINGAGVSVVMNVYVSNNPGAFTEAELSFN